MEGCDGLLKPAALATATGWMLYRCDRCGDTKIEHRNRPNVSQTTALPEES